MEFSPKLRAKLSQYGAYHRSRRNLLTHFFGVPLIVFAVMILLAKPGIWIGAFYASVMWPVLLATVAYYFTLDAKAGAIMGVLFFAMGLAAQPFGFYAWPTWLALGVGIFVVGWILQFIGHHFEGKKPAFVDDLIGLAIGPLFVTTELLFRIGVWRSLEAAIEADVGPTRA
jgi:uncharacterized membrane protein YGL010W